MTIEMRLPDMSCGHCVKVVTETVQRIDAQAQLTIDLPGRTVRIESGQPREPFAQALAEEGYPAAAE